MSDVFNIDELIEHNHFPPFNPSKALPMLYAMEGPGGHLDWPDFRRDRKQFKFYTEPETYFCGCGINRSLIPGDYVINYGDSIEPILSQVITIEKDSSRNSSSRGSLSKHQSFERVTAKCLDTLPESFIGNVDVKIHPGALYFEPTEVIPWRGGEYDWNPDVISGRLFWENLFLGDVSYIFAENDKEHKDTWLFKKNLSISKENKPDWPDAFFELPEFSYHDCFSSLTSKLVYDIFDEELEIHTCHGFQY